MSAVANPRAKRKPKAEPVAEALPVVLAVKGFDKDWKCRGYQFAVGQTYTHSGKVEACSSGFHACENPLDVFSYYPPGDSRFAVVEVSGELSRHDDDSKIAAGRLTVKAELKIPALVDLGVRWILDRITSTKTESNTGDRSAATNTGDQSAATNTGYQSAATNTGDRSAATNTGDQSAATNTGDRSAATNTGYQSAATNTGDQSAATNTGYRSAATNTGYQSAATNTGYQSAATNTGDQSAATNTGYRSAATNTGDQSAATNTGYQSAAEVSGADSIAIASGCQGRARASKGSALVLCYRDDDYKLRHVWSGIAGRDGIEPDTWYRLDAKGKPERVS